MGESAALVELVPHLRYRHLGLDDVHSKNTQYLDQLLLGAFGSSAPTSHDRDRLL